jgi:uncharacterized protein
VQSIPSIQRLLLAAIFCATAIGLMAAEVMPPKPKRYFNDYAGVTSVEVQQKLDRRLEDLEKTNSTQVVVAIFKKMQSDSSIEDYTVRVAQSWGVGRKEKNNGAVLFIFVEDRKMFLQVGYGLEGALPDAVAKDITEFRIKPHLRNGDYDAGVTAGVDAIIQAIRGEYKGTGRTVREGERARKRNGAVFFGLLIFFLLMAGTRRRRRGYVYGGSGRSGWSWPVIWTGGGGGGWSSGGGGGGWSGGFSGGGGSFGGGGAGSSW